MKNAKFHIGDTVQMYGRPEEFIVTELDAIDEKVVYIIQRADGVTVTVPSTHIYKPE